MFLRPYFIAFFTLLSFYSHAMDLPTDKVDSKFSQKVFLDIIADIKVPSSLLNPLRYHEKSTVDNYLEMLIYEIKARLKNKMGISELSRIDIDKNYLTYMQINILSVVLESHPSLTSSFFKNGKSNLFYLQKNIIDCFSKGLSQKIVGILNGCQILRGDEENIFFDLDTYLKSDYAGIVKSLENDYKILAAEEKVLLGILREIHPGTPEWLVMGTRFLDQGGSIQSLIGLLESRLELSPHNKINIIHQLKAKKSSFLNSYVMGLIPKGEFNAKELLDLFESVDFYTLSLFDWVMLIDFVFKDHQKEGYYSSDELKEKIADHKLETNLCKWWELGFIIESPKNISRKLKEIEASLRKAEDELYHPIMQDTFRKILIEAPFPKNMDIFVFNYLMTYYPHEKFLFSKILEKISGGKLFSEPVSTKTESPIGQPSQLPLKNLQPIYFIASPEPSGDGITPSTFDYFMGVQYPWTSLLSSELEKQRYQLKLLNWKDLTIDWLQIPHAFIGPIWGYSIECQSFDHFQRILKESNVTLINSERFIRWNTEKTYLEDLNKEGIPIIPTLIIPADSQRQFKDILRETQELWKTNKIILKGIVGAGGFDFHEYKEGEEEAAQHHLEILKFKNKGAVIQPFQDEIYRKCEFSFIFFENILSHFYVKLCKKGCKLVQAFYGGRSFHVSKRDLDLEPDKIMNQIKEFRPDTELTIEDILLAHDQIYFLHHALKEYYSKKGILMPMAVRIDCILIENELSVAEIEGLEPYMEFKEASIHDSGRNIVSLYADTVIRHHRVHSIRESIKKLC